MKPVYKCDYCSFMGTKEETKKHESECRENYDLMSCYTCKHRGKMTMVDKIIKYECNIGKDIPAGMIIKYCDTYEQKEKGKYDDLISGIFGGIF